MGQLRQGRGLLGVVLLATACGGIADPSSADAPVASGGWHATGGAGVTGGQRDAGGSGGQSGSTRDSPVILVSDLDCGNGKLDSNEGCDDGNHRNGDGCNEYCYLESAACAIGQEHCVNVAQCGDGILTYPEACDDGNLSSGDGCPENCAVIEKGWVCLGAGPRCRPICGDGAIAGGESCDDGNVLAGDGCSAHCSLEVLPRTPAGVCGDGALAEDEQCDEGGSNRDDVYGGCMRNCHLGPYCGDAIVNGLEACDFGPSINTPGVLYGDRGCSMTCRYNPYCGDFTLDYDFDEQCDNGANWQTSWCTNLCMIYLP